MTCGNKRLLNVNEITRFWQQKTLKKPVFLYRTNYLVVKKIGKKIHKKKKHAAKNEPFFFTAAAAKGLINCHHFNFYYTYCIFFIFLDFITPGYNNILDEEL